MAFWKVEFLKLEGALSEGMNQSKQYFSWLGKASLGYELDNGIRIEMGPQVHSSFKSSLSEYQIETKRHYIGVNFNLSKKF